MSTTLENEDADTKALLDRLDEGIQAVGSPEAWRSYLKFMAGNYRYSPTNAMLIMMQLENPTAIRGYKAWQDLGRQVRKGEKGAYIRQRVTVPAKDEDGKPRLGPDGKPQRSIVNFKWTKVFDIAQTDGPPIPDLTPKAVNGKVPQAVRSALEAHIKALGYKYEVGLTGAADGFTNPEMGSPVIFGQLPRYNSWEESEREVSRWPQRSIQRSSRTHLSRRLSKTPNPSPSWHEKMVLSSRPCETG